MARSTLLTVAVVVLVVLSGCAGLGGNGGDGTVGGGDGTVGGGDGNGGDGTVGGDGSVGGQQTAMSGGDGAGGDAGASYQAEPAETESVGYAVGGAKDINNFRDNVENGYLPIETDVTHQGLFYDYYFDTGQSEPCEELFCPSYSQAVTEDPLSGEEEYYMTVGLNSGISASDFERKKLNLVIVLDTSGSMDEAFDQYYYDDNGTEVETERRPKIEAAKDSVVALTDHLEDGDRLGVVGYDNDARTIVEMGAVGERDMSAVRSEIRSARAGGGTNLQAGMQRATGMVEEYADADPEEYETRIIYVTDAMPNLGDTSGSGLGAQLQRDAERGVYSTFVGVGVDFNTRLVETISDVEGANHYSVHSAAQFRERMDRGFEYMVTPLVFDLNLTVESDGYEIAEVYGSPSADEATGELLHVDTLFPSRTSGGRTKGGVVLVKLERTGDADEVTLTASYEDRNHEAFETTETVTFQDRDPEHFDNSGIRKAVLLSRYSDLMKGWVQHERARLSETAPDPEPPEEGIEPPEERDLGEWERQSTDLVVSEEYADRIATFNDHFESEMNAIGDDNLSQEVALMETILETGEDGESGGESIRDPGIGPGPVLDPGIGPSGAGNADRVADPATPTPTAPRVRAAR